MPPLPPILVVDVETTGLDLKAAGLVEIGAVWLTGPRENEEFEIKCRPWQGAIIEQRALEVNGCDWLNDPTVAPECAAMHSFLEWVGFGPVLLAGHNPRYDWEMLKASRDRLYSPALGVIVAGEPPEFPFPHRTIDVHSLAVCYAIAAGEEVTGKGIYMDRILSMLGLPEEPKPHRAIRGARAEAEALRVLFGMPNILRDIKA
jgi:DNA polymerase III epsilon subunit-like protein